MSDCKLWDGPRYGDGLPRIDGTPTRTGGQLGHQPAAVVILEEKIGRKLESHEMVAWSCANRFCVNKAHLFAVHWKKEELEEPKKPAPKKGKKRGREDEHG